MQKRHFLMSSMKLKRKINVLVNTSLVRGSITSPSLEVLVLRINAVQRSEDSILLYLIHLERKRDPRNVHLLDDTNLFNIKPFKPPLLSTTNISS